jgi:hypothetical protein
VSERGYLWLCRDPKDLESGRAFLEAKRNVPLAWVLAFERDDVRDGQRIVRKRQDAIALLRRRFGASRGVLGPKVAAIGYGFIGFLEAQSERWLVVDAEELASAWEGIDDYLAERFTLAEAWPDLDGEALDADEYGIERDDIEDEDALVDVVEPYRFVGGSLDEDLAWLRPPSSAQESLVAVARAAFERAGYTQVEGPRAFEDYDEIVFTHPKHDGVRFAVRVAEDEGAALFAQRGKRQIALGNRLVDVAELDAWANLVAEHLGLLSFQGGDAHWATCAGANDFGERMPALPEHAARLRQSLEGRFVERIVRFETDPRLPFVILNLGPTRALRLDRVIDPAWEPHVRASLVEGIPGEPWWQGALPHLILPPSVQHALSLEWLGQLPGKRIANAFSLELSPDGRSVTPERFDGTGRPVTKLDRTEVEGTYVFVGANLVIVTADGTRSAFRFVVPPDLDRRLSPFVSSFRTAPSGERFASVLRIGTRVWRFDNDGKLIG